MARSRNIKPGFFKNEELADIEPFGRLLYIGLWTLADREGRLEDRPKRIKAELFPYDNLDLDVLLNQLFKRNFIIRYQVDGESYIEIPKFLLHQNPHIKEPKSIIPSATREIGASTIQALDKNSSSPADSLNLIPDSLKWITSPGQPPYGDIVESYNGICNKLPKVIKVTEARKKAIKARWNQHNDIDFYYDLFNKANDNPFLTGSNERNWMADFDWLMKEQNMVKVMEGKYDKQSNKQLTQSGMDYLLNKINGGNDG